HAGDAETMRRSIEAARDRKVAIGAHPSLFDRENFGRKELAVKSDEVFDAVVYQLGVFQAIADAANVRPSHVKPHGALYNMAVRVVRMLREGKVRAVDGVDVDVRAETICLHGDTPGAVDFARVLKSRLEKEGVSVRAPQVSKEK